MDDQERLLAQSRAYRRSWQARAEFLLQIDRELVAASVDLLAKSRYRLATLDEAKESGLVPLRKSRDT
jgi:hypothetical protein